MAEAREINLVGARCVGVLDYGGGLGIASFECFDQRPAVVFLDLPCLVGQFKEGDLYDLQIFVSPHSSEQPL